VDRRSFLRLTGTGLAAATLSGCARSGEYGGPERRVRIAAGEPGGFYTAFARLLTTEVDTAEPRLHMSVIGSDGSVANVELLRSRQAELGLILADTAESAQQGGTGPAVPLRALGRVYENYLHLVVRAGSPLHDVRDLVGRTVSLGAPRSGTSFFASRMLSRLGLRPGVDLRASTLPLEEGASALREGRIDALFFSGGVPTPALSALDDQVGIRVLPLDATTPGVRPDGSATEQVLLPPGAYRLAGDVPTIGMANLLVCTPELPSGVASAIVGVLVRRASHLVPREALGTQFLDVRTLIGTGEIPLHPGAQAAYRALHG
jgi:TRAP transporter TAXI family solute receptor